MTIPIPTTTTAASNDSFVPHLMQNIQAMNDMIDNESRLAYSEYMEAKMHANTKKKSIVLSPSSAMRKKTIEEDEDDDHTPPIMKRQKL